jgi:hypothetical protein
MSCLESCYVSNTTRGLERACTTDLACISSMNYGTVVAFTLIFIPQNGLRLYGLAI